MVTSRWDKQNTLIRNLGLGLTTIVPFCFVAATILMDVPSWLNPAFSLVLFLIGLPLTIYLMREYPNKMMRVIKFDYEKIERDFRLLFKDNNIRYSRDLDNITYVYDFSGQGLKMSIRPYILFENTYDIKKVKETAMVIELHKLTADNTVFAEELAVLIDEMISRLEQG